MKKEEKKEEAAYTKFYSVVHARVVPRPMLDDGRTERLEE